MFAKMLWPTLFSCLLGYALAKTSTTSTSTLPTTTPKPTSTSPTVSLFLPMGSQDQLVASVISANRNQTAYLLNCASDISSSHCAYDPPLTVTEGESILIWTNTYAGPPTTQTPSPVTMQCQLVGAHIDETPIHGATSAVCIASSAIPGLGVAGSTSTLASTEINYIPVTVTAGAEKLAAASTINPPPSSSTSKAEAPAVTALVGFGLSGAIGMAVLVGL